VLSDIRSITGGSVHTCAIKAADGGVYCWGENNNGQLGNGYSNDTSVMSPPTTPVIVNMRQVSGGGGHTCASNGNLYCWGENGSGQLGIGNANSLDSPPALPVLSGVTQIVTGQLHTCALLTTRGVVCWGNGYDGELGNGIEYSTNVFSPPSTPVLTGVSNICAGAYHP